MSDENKGWQRLQQIAAKTVTSGGVNTAVTWEQHIAKCHLFTQRDALEVVAHVAALAAQVESLRQQREDLQSEVERLKGEAKTAADEMMYWNTEAVRLENALATARADALREVREKVEDIFDNGDGWMTRDEVLALLDAPRGET